MWEKSRVAQYYETNDFAPISDYYKGSLYIFIYTKFEIKKLQSGTFIKRRIEVISKGCFIDFKRQLEMKVKNKRHEENMVKLLAVCRLKKYTLIQLFII